MSGSRRLDGYSPGWKYSGNDLDNRTRRVSIVWMTGCSRMGESQRITPKQIPMGVMRSHGSASDW